MLTSLGVDLRGYILEAFPSDTWYQEVRIEIKYGYTLDGKFLGYFLVSNGLLQHLGHIYELVLGDLCTLVLSEVHCSPYSTHPKQLYFCVGMRHDVVDFVS